MVTVTRRKRFWVLLFVGVAILAMILLAAAFRDLELSRQGRPLPRSTQEALPEARIPQGPQFLKYFYAALFFLGSLFLLVLIIYGLASRRARKEFFRRVVYLLWPLLILLAVRLWFGSSEEEAELVAQELPVAEVAPSMAEAVPAPAVEFTARLPPWSVWIASLILAFLLAAGLVAAAWFVWRQARRPATSLELLGQEAQVALDALLAGADLRDTVMRCYYAMGRVLLKHKGIVRGEAMTPREFEESLGEAGLPDGQVRRLTRLFEGVRYGAKVPGEQEANQAIDCLTAIVEACRSSP